MIREDARGRRVAIVADCLINPGSALYAGLGAAPGPVLDVLIEDGWGMMKPPPHVLGDAVGRPAIHAIAGDAVDYRQHDFKVVILAADGLPQGGLWLDLLESAFRELGATLPAVARLSLGAGGAAGTSAAAIRAALAAAVPAATPAPA